jgi:hypothetical protein
MENTNTITEGNKKFLYDLVSELALKDYKQANPHPKMYKNGKTNHKPYSLSMETQEAHDMYKIACKSEHTAEEVEQVKAYILKRKLAY